MDTTPTQAGRPYIKDYPEGSPIPLSIFKNGITIGMPQLIGDAYTFLHCDLALPNTTPLVAVTAVKRLNPTGVTEIKILPDEVADFHEGPLVFFSRVYTPGGQENQYPLQEYSLITGQR